MRTTCSEMKGLPFKERSKFHNDMYGMIPDIYKTQPLAPPERAGSDTCLKSVHLEELAKATGTSGAPSLPESRQALSRKIQISGVKAGKGT